MMQSPGMLIQFPAPRPTVLAMLASPPRLQNEELLLAEEETDFDEKGLTLDSLSDTSKMNDIRKESTNIILIGKSFMDIDKEQDDNDADDDDPNNADDSKATLIGITQMLVLSLFIFNQDLPNSPPLSR